MSRLLGLFLVAVLALAGCATAPRQLSTPTPTPVKRSVEPTDTLRTLHGDDLIAARASASPSYALLQVELKSGEPTGVAPFIGFNVLRSMYPGRQNYQLDYRLPAGRAQRYVIPPGFSRKRYDAVVYAWQPATGRIKWAVTWFTGDVGTGAYLGAGSGIDTATIAAAATRAIPPPLLNEPVSSFGEDD